MVDKHTFPGVFVVRGLRRLFRPIRMLWQIICYLVPGRFRRDELVKAVRHLYHAVGTAERQVKHVRLRFVIHNHGRTTVWTKQAVGLRRECIGSQLVVTGQIAETISQYSAPADERGSMQSAANGAMAMT